MNLQKELIRNDIILSIFDKSYYNESIYEVLKELKGKKICYVSLNKTAENLENSFKFHKLPTDKMFFIDTVSRGIGKSYDKGNTLFVSSPAALTELSIFITESLRLGKFEVVLFDSLSTLNIYRMEDRATQRFTSSVINKIKSSKKQGIFTCLEEDADSDLIKNSFMYVDKVLYPSVFFHALKSKNRKNLAAVSSVTAVLLAFIAILGFNGILKQELTGYSIAENIPADPNFFLLLSGAFGFALIMFIGAVLYKRYSLRLISDEELEQMPAGKGSAADLKKNVRSKILGWLGKVE